MKRLALLLPLLALAAAPARAEDPATNAAPVYLASMLDLGSSSTARNQEVVTAEGVWLANLSDRHPGGCIRTIRALLATNGVEVSIDVLPGTKMKTVPTSNGIVRLEPVKLREWVNHEKVLVPFADVPCVVQLKKWADVFGNEAWSRVLLERRDPSAATLSPPRIETAFSSKSSRAAPSVLAATNRSDRAVALLAVETVAGKHKSGFRANPAILRLAPGEGGTIEIRRDPIPLGTPILTLFDLSSGIRVPVAEFPATP